jgi:hypothetical protein
MALDLLIGDVVEIDGRRYDAVSDKEGSSNLGGSGCAAVIVTFCALREG